MTCPNCRGETHRYDRHIVCSAGCGWSLEHHPYNPDPSGACVYCGEPRAGHAQPDSEPPGDVGVRPHGALTVEQELEAYRRIAYDERQRHIARERDLTAAKVALEVQLREANEKCVQARMDLANEREAHEAKREALANMTEERDMQQFHARDVVTERDALAAQLKAAREALAEAARNMETRAAGLRRAHSACSDEGVIEKARSTADVLAEDAACARAALAAPGPGGTQG